MKDFTYKCVEGVSQKYLKKKIHSVSDEANEIYEEGYLSFDITYDQTEDK